MTDKNEIAFMATVACVVTILLVTFMAGLATGEHTARTHKKDLEFCVDTADACVESLTTCVNILEFAQLSAQEVPPCL